MYSAAGAIIELEWAFTYQSYCARAVTSELAELNKKHSDTLIIADQYYLTLEVDVCNHDLLKRGYLAARISFVLISVNADKIDNV